MDLHNSLEHSPLFEAASLGHFPCVRLLLRAGSKTSIPGPLGRSSLHAACLCGSHETVQLLLRSSDCKSLVSARDSAGATAMHYAAGIVLHYTMKTFINCTLSIVLCSSGKDRSATAATSERSVSVRTGQRGTQLGALPLSLPLPHSPRDLSLLGRPEDQTQARLLPALPHSFCLRGYPPAHRCSHGQSRSGQRVLGPQVFCKLIRQTLALSSLLRGYSRQERGSITISHLTSSVEITTFQIVKLLSDVSPDLLNKPDLSQNSLLHYAAATGNTELTEFFLSHSLSSMFLNHQNGEGRTPLHLAVIHTHLSCIDLLLGEAGIDLNVPDSERWSPLHFAISLGSSGTVRALLASGAKFDSDHFRAIPAVVVAVERDFIGE